MQFPFDIPTTGRGMGESQDLFLEIFNIRDSTITNLGAHSRLGCQINLIPIKVSLLGLREAKRRQICIFLVTSGFVCINFNGHFIPETFQKSGPALTAHSNTSNC